MTAGSTAATAATTVKGLLQPSEADIAAQQQKLFEQQTQDAQLKEKQQTALMQRQLLSGALPGAVSQTSGYLTDLGNLSLAGAQANVPGSAFEGAGLDALKAFLGKSGGDNNLLESTFGISGGNTGLTA